MAWLVTCCNVSSLHQYLSQSWNLCLRSQRYCHRYICLKVPHLKLRLIRLFFYIIYLIPLLLIILLLFWATGALVSTKLVTLKLFFLQMEQTCFVFFCHIDRSQSLSNFLPQAGSTKFGLKRKKRSKLKSDVTTILYDNWISYWK